VTAPPAGARGEGQAVDAAQRWALSVWERWGVGTSAPVAVRLWETGRVVGEAGWMAGRTVGGRLAWWRVAAGVGLVVTVAGGIVTWRAVDRLNDAHYRALKSSEDMLDLTNMLTARFEDAIDLSGLRGGGPVDDDELEAHLAAMIQNAEAIEGEPVDAIDMLPGDAAEVFRSAQGDAADAAEALLAAEETLLEDAAGRGGVDERLRLPLRRALDELDSATVSAEWEDASDANVAARRTIAVVLTLTLAVWAVAVWLARPVGRRG
jgi:hypothetical protein